MIKNLLFTTYIVYIVLLNGCPNRIGLPENHWVHKYNVYVKSLPVDPGVTFYLFCTSDPKGKIQPKDDPKFSNAGEMIISIVNPGRKATEYDIFGNPFKTESEAFIRFKLVEFDKDSKITYIGLVNEEFGMFSI
jgi:hypothetical protein